MSARASLVALLAVAGCRAPEQAWVPPPIEGSVTFLVRVRPEAEPVILGRVGPGMGVLRFSEPDEAEDLYALSFDRSAVLALSPRVDGARWSELELRVGAEKCERRILDERTERRPLPADLSGLRLDGSTWTPAPLPEVLSLRLSLDVPRDSQSCGGPVPRLELYARVEEGFSIGPRTHRQADFERDYDPFWLRNIRPTTGDAALVLTEPYLYWLRADRRLLVAEAQEVLSTDEIEGLPSGEWRFSGLERWPGRPDHFVALLVNGAGTSPRSTLVEVSTSTSGFESARHLSSLAERSTLLSIAEDGALMVVGSGTNTITYGRPPYEATEQTATPEGGEVRRVIATGRTDYPFALGTMLGVVTLFDPWSGESQPLGEGDLSARTEALAVSPGPPWRIDQLRFNGLLFSWVEPGPGTLQVVPMPAELEPCSAMGDECTAHFLPRNPDALVRSATGDLVVAPFTCPRLFSWNPERDCLRAWETEPPPDLVAGFEGFDALTLAGPYLWASARGGILYRAALE